MRFGYLNDAILTDIANAIREKTGTTISYTPIAMPDAISSIRSKNMFGGNIANIVARTVTHISNDTASKIGKYALAYANSLEEATFNSATSIDERAFYSCHSLESISCPVVKTIGSYAFFDCNSLTDVSFESAQEIGSSAFQACASLEKLSLGSTTTDTSQSIIQSSAFYGCENLTALILWAPLDTRKAIVSLQNDNAFTGTPIANGTGYIYVPRIQLDINGAYGYLNVSGWKTFRSQFRAIEDYPEICGITTPELEIPEDAVRVYLAVGQTYSDNMYEEFDEANISTSNAEVIVSDATVVNARCEEDDEPYLYITGLKEGTVLVELPQIDYSYHVTVTPSVEHTIYKYGQVDVPIAEGDTVTVVSCPSWMDCVVSYDDMIVFIYDNGVGRGKTGYVVLESEMNGPITHIVKSGY